MKEKAVQLLKENGLRKTTVRLNVLLEFLQSKQAYGQGDLEAKWEAIDRITLYRTLKTFEQKGIIHQAVDGSGKIKYALCKGDCSENQHHDHHAHFHCVACKKTICLEHISVPEVTVPANYQLHQSHLVLSGLCEVCRVEH
ncbi:MAG: transcriptional repressor [Bacteroidota bacterium]